MTRFTTWTRSIAAAAAVFAGALVACGVPGTQPTEVSPMAPRPGPVEPTSTAPVPGAPDPIPPAQPGPTRPAPAAPRDGGVASITSLMQPAVYRAAAVVPDAGVAPPPSPDAKIDAPAAPLPPITDAGLPADASRQAR